MLSNIIPKAQSSLRGQISWAKRNIRLGLCPRRQDPSSHAVDQDLKQFLSVSQLIMLLHLLRHELEIGLSLSET